MTDVKNKIELGDKIFASIIIGGKVLAEFVLESVANISEVTKKLREATRACRGMATMYIRNASKGWCQKRSVMLYPDVISSFNNKIFTPSRNPYRISPVY